MKQNEHAAQGAQQTVAENGGTSGGAQSMPRQAPGQAPVNAQKPRPVYRLLVGICLVLIAFNLRTLFSSLSVLLPEIISATGMNSLSAGLLTTLPVFCLGLFAPIAPRLGERIGIERTLLLAVIFLACGTALRASGSMTMMFVGTALAGACIATSNVLLPGVVKRDFSDKAALLTGFYTMALSGGAALAAALTMPAYLALGNSWQMALAIWAVPVVIIGFIWAILTFRTRHTYQKSASRVTGLWRDRLAWQLTLFMGLQSSLAFSVFGWLAPILRERGMDGSMAGVVVSVSIGFQLVACLIVPTIAVRSRNQSMLNVVLIAFATIGILAMLYMPLWSVWYWAVLQGLGLGGLIAAAMTEIVLRSPNPRVAAHLSGMAQCVGYMIASLAPLLVGIIRDLTGSYSATAILFILIGCAAAYNGWGAGRALHVKATSE